MFLYSACWLRIVLSVIFFSYCVSLITCVDVFTVERADLRQVFGVSYGNRMLFHQLDVTPGQRFLKWVSLSKCKLREMPFWSSGAQGWIKWSKNFIDPWNHLGWKRSLKSWNPTMNLTLPNNIFVCNCPGSKKELFKFCTQYMLQLVDRAELYMKI